MRKTKKKENENKKYVKLRRSRWRNTRYGWRRYIKEIKEDKETYKEGRSWRWIKDNNNNKNHREGRQQFRFRSRRWKKYR